MHKPTTSSHNVGLRNRIRYTKAMLVTNVRATFTRHCFDGMRTNILQYWALYREYCDGELTEAKVLEIGFGQRPVRVFALASLGVDVTGVDIEQPTLGVADLNRVRSRNGMFRMLKAATRFALFDRKFYTDFSQFMQAEFGVLSTYDRSRLVVADSAEPEFWKANPGPFDFVYSEDVFEHIPPESLPSVVSQMADNMTAGGVAIVRPMVFTGICGGHHIDWYPGTFGKPTQRDTPPWDHLLENKHVADTYLNRLSRGEYRKLFETRFEILQDENEAGNLGKEYLTPLLRERLSAYEDYELFSNNVLFVLRKR